MPPSSTRKRKSSKSEVSVPELPDAKKLVRGARLSAARLKGLANLPRHVAIIMDGNGRWASEKGLPRVRGHQEGAQSVAEVVSVARQLGIEYLTLYAFSTENWQRPEFEVNALMQLLDVYLNAELDTMIEHGIRLHTIGDTSKLPAQIRKHLEATVEKTSCEKEMTLSLALSYGSRQEILNAVREAVDAAREGRLSSNQISEQWMNEQLYTAEMPDPDLLIRTAGEFRLSNFLLWQCAYTEFYVTKTFWPDFRRPHFLRALRNFSRRERRFGLTSEQLQKTQGKG